MARLLQYVDDVCIAMIVDAINAGEAQKKLRQGAEDAG
jgi:hypothetical protein